MRGRAYDPGKCMVLVREVPMIDRISQQQYENTVALLRQLRIQRRRPKIDLENEPGPKHWKEDENVLRNSRVFGNRRKLHGRSSTRVRRVRASRDYSTSTASIHPWIKVGASDESGSMTASTAAASSEYKKTNQSAIRDRPGIIQILACEYLSTFCLPKGMMETRPSTSIG